MSKEFTHLEMEAALCVWECLNDWTLTETGKPEWKELRDGVGSAEMRMQSIALGKWCLAVYDICNGKQPDCFDGMAYDWEVIPEILSHSLKDGKPAIYEQDLPTAETVAAPILEWVSKENEARKRRQWLSEARREAVNQWGYAALVEDHSEKATRAYEGGESAAAFVKWLGEKYGLISAADWNG